MKNDKLRIKSIQQKLVMYTLFVIFIFSFNLLTKSFFLDAKELVWAEENEVSLTEERSNNEVDDNNRDKLKPTYVDSENYGLLKLTPYKVKYSQTENREKTIKLKVESKDEIAFKNFIDKNPHIEDINLPTGIVRLGYSNSLLKLKCLSKNQPCDIFSNLVNEKKEYYFEYDVLVSSQMSDGVYPITYSLVVDGQHFPFTTYIQLENENLSSSTDLRISDIDIPEKVEVEKPFNLSFRVFNLSDKIVKKLKISLDLPDGIVNLSQQSFVVDNLYSVTPLYTVKLKANSEIASKYHNIKIIVQEVNEGNTVNNVIEQYTGTLVLGGTGGKDFSSYTKPIVLISKVETFDAEGEASKKIIAGHDFNLKVTLKNTSVFALRNMKISFVNEEGSLVARDGGNSVYYPFISSGQTFIAELPMSVERNAEQKRTNIKVNFYYEYATDKQLETTDNISLNVLQDTKAEFKIINDNGLTPISYTVGTPIFVRFNIANLGRTAWRNVKIKFEGEHLFSEQENVVIGKMEAGSNQEAEAVISFSEIGQREGKAVLTFEDPSGEIHEIENKLNYEIIEEVLPENGLIEPIPPFEEEKSSKWLLYISLIVLIILILNLVFYLRKKKALKRKALLMEDEEMM